MVDKVELVESVESIQRAVVRAGRADKPVCIAGGRHAMGGQQFCRGGILLDTKALDRVLHFDPDAGSIQIEAGIQWPALIDYLSSAQGGSDRQWSIAQKQTGADRLSLGGAIAANVHGRGLSMKPLVADVESFDLVDAEGALRHCSRGENAELFRATVGGYGLFGCVYSATLRLSPRKPLERVVELRRVDELMPMFESRIREGFLYGDFQFATDERTDEFLSQGVFSCYRPIEWAGQPPPGQRALSRDDWQNLIYLAHTDKRRAFDLYSAHYLGTSGQIYYSDAHQLADYTDGYHVRVDTMLKSAHSASEVITEIYVPRNRLVDFMESAAEDFRTHAVNVIYGTIRLVEREDESFLAWATEPWACVIFNLCVAHTPEGMERGAEAFRRLIDLAIERRGSFYLTYHRWATRGQMEACYPRFPEFLLLKRELDPGECFQSDWYRHYTEMFSTEDKRPPVRFR